MEKSSTDIRVEELTGRVGRFETDVKVRFDRVDKRFDQVDRRFERFEDKVDARFANVDARFDRLEARFDKWGRIVAAGVVTVAGSLIAKVLGL